MPLKFDVQKYQANFDPTKGGPFVSIQDVMDATSQMWGEVLTTMVDVFSKPQDLSGIISNPQSSQQLIDYLFPPDGSVSPLWSGFSTSLSGSSAGTSGNILDQSLAWLTNLGPNIVKALENSNTTIPPAQITGLLDNTGQIVTDLLGNASGTTPWTTTVADIKTGTGIDLTSWNSFISSIGAETGVDLSSLETNGVVTAPLNSFSIVGQILPTNLGNVHVGSIGGAPPQLLINPNFDAPNSLAGLNEWYQDGGTAGPAGSGLSTSAYTTANGSLLQLFSNAIPVSSGQTMAFSGWMAGTGFAGAANSVGLQVQTFYKNQPVALTDLTMATPGAWQQLSYNWLVPSGVDMAKLVLVVKPTATAGVVRFTQLSATKTGILPQNLVTGLPDLNTALGQLGQIANAEIVTPINTAVQQFNTWWNSLMLNATTVKSVALPNIPAGTGPGQSSDLLSHLTNVAAQTGSSGTNMLTAALQALQIQSNTLQDVAAQLQQQKTSQSGATNSGQSMLIRFADYGVWANVPVTTTYGPIPGQSSHGSGHFIINNNGQAAWQAVNDGDVSGLCLYAPPTGPATTQTVYQEIQASLAGLPNGGNAKNFAIARSNAAATDYVYGDVYLTTGFALMYEVGCYIGGVQHVWQTGPVNTINLNFTMLAGVGSNPNVYQGYSGTQEVFSFTNDGSHGEAIFPADLSHTHWGFRSDTYNNGQNYPAPANYVGCSDNAPPTVPGSGVRLYRTQTSSIAENLTLNTVYTNWGDGSNRFFDANSEASLDMTILANVLIGTFDSRTSTGGVAGVQVANAGRYMVAGRVDIGAANTSAGAVSMGLVVQRYNSAGVFQESHYMGAPAFFVNGFGGQYNTGFCGGSGIIGCEAGDILQLGYMLDPGTSGTGRNGAGTLSTLQLTGEVSGGHTYFEVALANWSYN
jgi:hypothetical protein